MLQRIFAAFLIFASMGASAQSMQCADINEGSLNSVELRSGTEGYMNCFALPVTPQVSRVYLIASGAGGFSYSAELFSIDAAGNRTSLGSKNSDANGALLIAAPYSGYRVGLGLLPISAFGRNKHLSVSYYVKDDVGVIVADFVDLPTPPKPTKPGLCSRPPCPLPHSLPADISASASSLPLCSASTTIPAGKNADFDIDANLAGLEARRAAIDTIDNAIDREAVRAAVMTSLFAPGQTYDLKNSAKYPSSQEFGNYFYGMAASKMGYTEQTALTAGAVVQQIQNYANSGHPDSGQLGLMFRNIVFAAISGLGDNPDDPPMITAGFRAANSCATKSASTTGTNGSNGSGGEGGLAGIGRGWQGGSINLPPGCYGHCGQGGWTITITPPKAAY